MRTDPVPILQALDAMQVALDQLRVAMTADARPPQAEFLTIKDAARVLRLSERTVRRRATEGAGVMVGGVWRIAIEAVRGKIPLGS